MNLRETCACGAELTLDDVQTVGPGWVDLRNMVEMFRGRHEGHTAPSPVPHEGGSDERERTILDLASLALVQLEATLGHLALVVGSPGEEPELTSTELEAARNQLTDGRDAAQLVRETFTPLWDEEGAVPRRELTEAERKARQDAKRAAMEARSSERLAAKLALVPKDEAES